MPDVLCVLNSTPTRSSIVPRGDQLRTPFSGCSVTAYRRAGCADRPSRAPSIARPAPHGKGIIIASCAQCSPATFASLDSANCGNSHTILTFVLINSASTLQGTEYSRYRIVMSTSTE